MEIGVGEYIRIRGEILQIEFITERSPDELYIKFREYASGNTFTKEEVKKWKHSKNIIDLIEVGDIVIGKDSHLFEVYAVGSDCVYINNLEEFVCVQDIKSIVTKEQMKEMEYRV